ncbi:hypothetical protein HG535_0C04190 [Zygotorulaspora mrakii]|uniref:Bacterial surface antigen (D15) domain-containing protein n=1 Tax=Zygotorulaspora mrakii TaxID=42260 RepID=A0A7H9B040_ZYGMR|nr:uncharacterized protein HG535_0C04190 [Zygotorulaspora mrakii]QLG72065.1 hypothetical protein HG535_0C04190 [Zygotorulaspora mrakii]
MSEKNSSVINKFEQATLDESSTKPLYFSKVTIEGDNGSSPLSNGFYKTILEHPLTAPLQNVDSSLSMFQAIRNNFLYTGLYQDVSVSFEQDYDSATLEYMRNGIPHEYGIELPIPTHAKISLKPSALYNSNAASTTINDDSASLAVCRTWLNQLGLADSEMLYWGINYNPIKSAWEGITCKGFVSVPLMRNPSIKGLLDFEYNELTDLSSDSQTTKKDYENVTSMGFKKSWILDNCKSIPFFYTGLSFTNRLSRNKNDKSGEAREYYLKTGVISQFQHDTRKFFGTLPISGYLLKLNNEYVLSQSNLHSLDESIENNFNKFQFNLEHHVSYLKNIFTRSFDLQFGGIVPMAEIESVHPADRFCSTGTNLLRGFQPSSSDFANNFYYKVGLNTSHKIYRTPLNSPLRLGLFLNIGNAFNDLQNAFDSYAAAAGASLFYKTPQADMDLTYAYPLTSRPQDIAKPGFSFGIKFSYF